MQGFHFLLRNKPGISSCVHRNGHTLLLSTTAKGHVFLKLLQLKIRGEKRSKSVEEQQISGFLMLPSEKGNSFEQILFFKVFMAM